MYLPNFDFLHHYTVSDLQNGFLLVFVVYLCLRLGTCLADGARAALSLAGTMLGYYPVRVLPSKTAIVPVNPTFLPRVRRLP